MLTRFFCTSFALGVAAAAVASAVPAAAADRVVEKACATDVRRLCPMEEKDTPALRYCMEAKVHFLSRRCVRALEDAGEMPRGYVKGH